MSNPDLILVNASVVTMDPQARIIRNGSLALRGPEIAAVGPAGDLLARFPEVDTFDCGGRVMIPGLINAHTHVPMTLMRGLEDDRRLDVWLLGYMMPVEREFVDPEFVELGTRIACAEMIRSGITCFADMYYFEEHVARATAAAGMRAICGQTVLKFPSRTPRPTKIHWQPRKLLSRSGWITISSFLRSLPMLPTQPQPISCRPVPIWPRATTSPCISTWPRLSRRSSSGVRNTTCRWYPGSKSRASWVQR